MVTPSIVQYIEGVYKTYNCYAENKLCFYMQETRESWNAIYYYSMEIRPQYFIKVSEFNSIINFGNAFFSRKYLQCYLKVKNAPV